MSKIVNEGES